MRILKFQILAISLIISFSFFSQQRESLYGGEMKLKITYDGYPLIGYTVTGKINDIAIGPSGVTNKNGDVTICSDPLPIPDITLEGLKESGGSKFSWSVSGFVRVLKQEGNLFHLDLKRVSESVGKMMGANPLDIAATYGVNINSNLGSEKSSSEYTSASIMGCDKPKSKGDNSTVAVNSDPRGTTDPRGSAANTGTSTYKPAKAELNGEASSEMKEDHERWAKEQDAKRAESKAKSDAFHAKAKADFESGKGFDNQATMYRNQISKLNDKISEVDQEISKSKKEKDKNDLRYEKKELITERKIKQLKLDKTNAEIANNRTMLKKSERTFYKEEIEKLEEELKEIKKDRKKKVTLSTNSVEQGSSSNKNLVNSESEGTVNAEEKESFDIVTTDNLSSMGVIKLKSKKLKMESKVKSLKLSLKTQGKLMAPDKKEEKEKELKSLEAQIDLIVKELEKRK